MLCRQAHTVPKIRKWKHSCLPPAYFTTLKITDRIGHRICSQAKTGISPCSIHIAPPKSKLAGQVVAAAFIKTDNWR